MDRFFLFSRSLCEPISKADLFCQWRTSSGRSHQDKFPFFILLDTTRKKKCTRIERRVRLVWSSRSCRMQDLYYFEMERQSHIISRVFQRLFAGSIRRKEKSNSIILRFQIARAQFPPYNTRDTKRRKQNFKRFVLSQTSSLVFSFFPNVSNMDKSH